MIRWFLRRQIAAFERTWNYDADYVREVPAGHLGRWNTCA
jgi:hypothetical protein